jgi:hypothetical protein
LRAILRGAAAVLARIRHCRGDVLGSDVDLSRWRRLGTVLGGLMLRGAPRWGAA